MFLCDIHVYYNLIYKCIKLIAFFIKIFQQILNRYILASFVKSVDQAAFIAAQEETVDYSDSRLKITVDIE